MAFIKAKVLENAQKYLNAGKLPQAIAEYQQVLRYEPDDQVTLMTIGDLFVRAGDPHQALAYFEKLAQLFLNDGFISKAIAIYKKIAKLTPDEVAPLERLAELYVQQGVMSEARPIYLQLAEAHLKGNRTQQAIEVLRKLLEVAPDNLRVQTRLAELYQAIGQEKEAASAFLLPGQRMLERREFAEAQKMAERALKMDPGNQVALALSARCLAGQNRPNQALELLHRVPAADIGPEVSSVMVELALQSGDINKAVGLARKAFDRGIENFPVAFDVCIALIEGGESDHALKLLAEIAPAVVQTDESERLVQALIVVADRMPGRPEPLEMLAGVYRQIGDSFRLPEALSKLADAAVSAGDLERARAALQEMVERDPENEAYKHRLAQVCKQLGIEVPEITPAVPVEFPAEELLAPVEAAAVPAAVPIAPTEVPLDEETERFVNQALTDVDLFSSYGLTQKGIDLLENVVQRVPTHLVALEKLLDLYLGSGDDLKTAELAGRLGRLFEQRGDVANAEKFGELKRRYERAAGRAAEEAAAAPPPAEFTIPLEGGPAEVPPPVEVAAQPVEESAVHEVDLSAEWAAMTEQAVSEQAPAPAKPPAPEITAGPVAEEIEINLDSELAAAPTVEALPEAPAPAQAVSYDWGAETIPLETGPAAPPQPTETPAPAEAATGSNIVFEELSSEISEADFQTPAPPPKPAARKPAAAAPVVPPPPARVPKAPPPPAPKAPPPPAPKVPARAPAAPPPRKPPVPPPAARKMTSAQFLSELSEELGEFEFPEPAAKAEPSAKEKPRAPATPKKKAVAQEHLREVFDEFKAEMGELAEEETEDLETHYNLGIAYREMGLLEEAIGEFQKVAKALQKGHHFRYTMQCFTLLGLSFMDKGQPKISTIWYEKALKTPNIDPESVLAVRYDLGVAQEMAGDTKAALESFSQVYAMNIDYRDVGERIAALQKRA